MICFCSDSAVSQDLGSDSICIAAPSVAIHTSHTSHVGQSFDVDYSCILKILEVEKVQAHVSPLLIG